VSLSLPETGVWRFDAFVLDAQRYELRGGDEVIRVEPQVFDVLTQLVRNCHRFVSKEELFDSVWGGRFIRTVRGRGYQFVGRIRGRQSVRTGRRVTSRT
jgi:DNA-binding winged helix-turn-helix (wHTH) protein